MKVQIKEKLYFSTWLYNYHLIINELAKQIRKEGGQIVSCYPELHKKNERTLIQNRSIEERKTELKITLQKLTGKANQEYVAKLQKELEKLEKINNDFKMVKYAGTFGIGLDFVMDNIFYFVEFNENPFFDFYYQKHDIEPQGDGSYKQKYNYYLEKLDKNFMDKYDFYDRLSQKSIKKIAANLLTQLKESRNSSMVYTKTRVHNLYDGGWHYERMKEERNRNYIVIE